MWTFPYFRLQQNDKIHLTSTAENHFEQTNQMIASQFIDFFSTVTTAKAAA